MSEACTGGGGREAHREERGEEFLGDPVFASLHTEQPVPQKGHTPNGHWMATALSSRVLSLCWVKNAHVTGRPTPLSV